MTITTAAELNALPAGTVITDRNGHPWYAIPAPFEPNRTAWLYRWPDNHRHTYARDVLDHGPFEITPTPHYRED